MYLGRFSHRQIEIDILMRLGDLLGIISRIEMLAGIHRFLFFAASDHNSCSERAGVCILFLSLLVAEGAIIL